jgi:uncharacterized protein (DUF488 family)
MSRIYTIGHSSRTWEEFVSILKTFDIHLLADIRRFPGSHRYPHFNQQSMRKNLPFQNIQYLWFEDLGGRRQSPEDEKSPNMGLADLQLRSYADHMQTKLFQDAVSYLLSLSARKTTALMCAEKSYTDCHRMLLSDYLTAGGLEVIHIEDKEQSRPHQMTPGAVMTKDVLVSYPATGSSQPDLFT